MAPSGQFCDCFFQGFLWFQVLNQFPHQFHVLGVFTPSQLRVTSELVLLYGTLADCCHPWLATTVFSDDTKLFRLLVLSGVGKNSGPLQRLNSQLPYTAVEFLFGPSL